MKSFILTLLPFILIFLLNMPSMLRNLDRETIYGSGPISIVYFAFFLICLMLLTFLVKKLISFLFSKIKKPSKNHLDG